MSFSLPRNPFCFLIQLLKTKAFTEHPIPIKLNYSSRSWTINNARLSVAANCRSSQAFQKLRQRKSKTGNSSRSGVSSENCN